MPRRKIQLDVEKVEALASRGLSFEQIAASLGITDGTLLQRRRENKEIEEAIKRGRDKGIAVVANKLFEAAKEGNTAAMIFFLKAQGGWTDRAQLEVTNNQPVQIVIKNDLSD